VTLAFLELERSEARVLGALRCVDPATGTRIDAPLTVRVAGAGVRRNRSGLYVIVSAQAPALAAHVPSFGAPPSTPPLASVALVATISDPAGVYLARRATIALPRDPLSTHTAQDNSLFRPIDVPMYPSGVAPRGTNWAVLRVTASEIASQDALGGALLLVTIDGTVRARGLTDWRGEALVCVPGLPVTTWSSSASSVVVNEMDAQVTLVFDAATGRRTPAAQVRAGGAPPAGVPVDPAALEAAQAALAHAAVTTKLATGREQSLSP